ncbi:family 43 glycosylhydrolase [Occultella kanbiaonis]|uniref:family 43 glycosylhydrolase n=1 Tax=Occultella kanbiaonis TaxID=2675754 RepID=UPI0012B781E9|nr:family 43 glycosylhydrolase [Occultella kanbiaonis]
MPPEAGSTPSTPALIVNGVPWFDDRGRTVNAHGACIVADGERYYLFGEYKTDDENRFIGFSCYSSPDLATWTFERLVLPPQPGGLLGPGRIGERVKVMRCPSTGRFIMLMHTDDLGYSDPQIGLASSDTVNGEYTFHGALTHGGEPIRGWDMGTFIDRDGNGYLLLHEGDVYRLSEDYTVAEQKVVSGVAPGGESPAMLERDGIYFLLFSNKTSWDRNDNYYLSAPALAGPWTHRGLLAPAGSLTWNSQCTFVLDLPVDGAAVPMYMGDRWSFPHQASAATYVWLPITVDGTSLTLGEYWPAWDVARVQPVPPESVFDGPPIEVTFRSEGPGDAVDVPFAGTQVALVGTADDHGGYALVEIRDYSGALVASLLIDLYAGAAESGLRYVGPELPRGEYSVRVTVTGDGSVFYKKDGTRLGTKGCRVALDRLLVRA